MSDPNTMSAATVSPEVPGADRRRGQVLFRTGTLGLALLIGYYASVAQVEDPLHLYLGIIIMVLAIVPSLQWAERAKFSLPIFEVFMITGLNTYAIPLLAGHEQLERFDSRVVTTAAMAVIAFQLTAIATYAAVTASPARDASLRRELIGKDASRFLTTGLFLATAYTVVNQFTDWIPYEYNGLIRAVAFALGILASFLQSRRWGTGELKPAERPLLVILVLIQALAGASSLMLINAIPILLLCLLGYVSGARRIPILPIITLLPLLAVLHNGKAAMREKYWGPNGNERIDIKVGDVPGLYTEWFSMGLETREDVKERGRNAKLLERTSLLHILCLVVSITPERQPYLDGKTYADIPGQFVPRILWPEKPGAHVSTSTLSIYYGLQTEEDTAKTTIGFGLLAEAYANFGIVGTILVGLAFAAFFKKAVGWGADSPMLSYPGLLLVVLIAWSFQTEYTVSLWVSSLFQAVVVVLGVPALVRHFFR